MKFKIAFSNFIAFILVLCAGHANSQSFYTGVASPTNWTVGVAKSFGYNLGLRAEYSKGSSTSSETIDGLNLIGSFQSSKVGFFADYYPMQGSFRLVAGLTINDIKASFRSASGISNINNTAYDLTDEKIDVNLTFPKTTTYLGVGYGHQFSSVKGLGLYADAGVSLGSFFSSYSVSSNGNSSLSNQDLSDQVNSIKNHTNGYYYLPSISVGVSYSF